MNLNVIYYLKKYFLFLICSIFSLSMVSCLEEGEETIALEKGKAQDLIIGIWSVVNVDVYVNDEYLSDLPENNLKYAVITFKKNNKAEVSLRGNIEDLTTTWNISEDNRSLFFYENNFTLVSLGKNKLVLEDNILLDNVECERRLVLEKISSEEETVGLDETKIISSSESGSVGLDGIKLNVPYGAVPKNSTGSDGKVAFSIKKAEELPASLPIGIEIVPGSNVYGYKIEPMNFTFNIPLTVEIQTNGDDVSRIALMRFNEYSGYWEEVPFSSINENGVAVSSVLELGHFIIVKKHEVSGGVHVSGSIFEAGYYYYLTLQSEDSNFSKRLSFTYNSKDLYMANVPLGTYTCFLTRELRNDLGSSSSGLEYSSVKHVNVTSKLKYGSGGFSTYQGWTEVYFENNNWFSGRPDGWGDATITYGTGKFQATLTWVNQEGMHTDYDLHLFGPDNLHVYFSNKRQGAFELDRDWISEPGNAIENIYSVDNDFPSGSYFVKVHHYGGTLNKRYNCRVIMDGVVVTSVTGYINESNQLNEIYTFAIE